MFNTDRMHQKHYLGADLGTGVSRSTQILAPNICGSSVRNVLLDIILVPEILKWPQDFWKHCGLLGTLSRYEHVLAYITCTYLFLLNNQSLLEFSVLALSSNGTFKFEASWNASWMGHKFVLVPLLPSFSCAAVDTVETECFNREGTIFVDTDVFVLKLKW
jgi:hypothetical protein